MKNEAIQFTNLSTNGSVDPNDPPRLAASRCLTILFCCARMAPKVHEAAAGGSIEPGALDRLVREMVWTLIQHGGSLDQDLQTVAMMLGVTIVPVAQGTAGTKH